MSVVFKHNEYLKLNKSLGILYYMYYTVGTSLYYILCLRFPLKQFDLHQSSIVFDGLLVYKSFLWGTLWIKTITDIDQYCFLCNYNF